MHLMQQRGIDTVMRGDGKRKVDFRHGCVLGPLDHLVWWPKPARPNWLSKQQYQRMPEGLWVRELRVAGHTLVQTTEFSAQDLAALYGMRWNIEVDFRSLKAGMNMDVLRCKSPAMVLKEIAVYLLTYNLGRWTIASTAEPARIPARAVSFTGARRLTWNFASRLRLPAPRGTSGQETTP